MSRHINIFYSQEDAYEMIRLIHEQGGILIHESGIQLDEDDIANFCDPGYSVRKYRFFSKYVIFEKSVICFDFFEKINRKCLRIEKSEAMSFVEGGCSSKIKNGHYCGGIAYYPEFFKKNEYFQHEEQFDNLYKILRKYIRKNFYVSQDKQYYISPICYELYKKGEYIPLTINNFPVIF